jgi:hypothetical protein
MTIKLLGTSPSGGTVYQVQCDCKATFTAVCPCVPRCPSCGLLGDWINSVAEAHLKAGEPVRRLHNRRLAKILPKYTRPVAAGM